MIHYLPTILPHETAYSWFSRYYVHSGCYSHKHALTNLFCKRSDTASKEFIGNLNKEARACIGKVYPLEQLVLEHTMFPQYGRFLPFARFGPRCLLTRHEMGGIMRCENLNLEVRRYGDRI